MLLSTTKKQQCRTWGRHDEREQTFNQLLRDGWFESNEGVILIAATNRIDVLDPALRPGRLIDE